jgi:fatty acid amide hydrolase 2
MLQILGYGRIEKIKRLRAAILQSMGQGSVMLWPVFPTTAPKHGFAWNPSKGPDYTLVFNCLGFPALAMPVGVTAEGLPLSVQIIGQPYEDEIVLAVAAELERALGGCKLSPISALPS